MLELHVVVVTTGTLLMTAFGQAIPGEGIWRYHVFCYNHKGQQPISCERNSIIRVNEVTRGYSPQYHYDPKSGPVCPVNPSCSVPHYMPGICDTERTCQVSPLTPRAPINHPCMKENNVTHSNYLLFNYSCISVTALSSQMLCEESSVIQSSGHIFSPGFPRVVVPGINRSCSCIIQAPRPVPISLQSFHLHLASRRPCRENLNIFADKDRQLLYVCSPDYRQPGWSVTFTTSVIRIDYVINAAGPDNPGGKVWLGFTANSSLWIRCGTDTLSISKTVPPLEAQLTPETTTEEILTTAPPSGGIKITPGVLAGIAVAGVLLIVILISSIVCTRKRRNRQNGSKRSKEGEGEIYAYINPASLSTKSDTNEKPPEPPPSNASTLQVKPGAKIRHCQSQGTKVPPSVYNLQYNTEAQYDTADATYYYYDELQPVSQVLNSGANIQDGYNKHEVFQLLNAAGLNRQGEGPVAHNTLSQMNVHRQSDQNHSHTMPHRPTMATPVVHSNTINPNVLHSTAIHQNTYPHPPPPNTAPPALPAGPPHYYEHLQYDPYTEIPALYAFLDKEGPEEGQHRF